MKCSALHVALRMFVFVFRTAPLVPEDTNNVFQQVVRQEDWERNWERQNRATKTGRSFDRDSIKYWERKWYEDEQTERESDKT